MINFGSICISQSLINSCSSDTIEESDLHMKMDTPRQKIQLLEYPWKVDQKTY